MPPKIKFTKEEIINATLELVRKNGEGAVNARSIAAALGCSTQPVFSNFASMEELDRAVFVAAYEQYLGFIKREVEGGKYPQYKAFGMAYIRFAKEERELFKLLFMHSRDNEELIPTPDFDESVEIIMKTNGTTKEKATLMHIEMWTCVHGIGVMLATSFLSLDWELISEMVTDVYQGIRARHLSEGNNK